MRVESFLVGMYQTNTYIIYDENTLEAIIIDPGDRPTTVIQFLRKKSLKPTGIVLTHHHIDHVGAVKELKKEYGCPVYIHKKDVEGLKELASNSMRLYKKKIEVQPDLFLKEGDTISAGQVTLKVVHTPGHTPGSICLQVVGEKVVFTGDTLFADGIGRTDLKGGNEMAIRRSLIERVNKWDDDVMIYPGHDSSATMAQVRVHNHLFRSIVAR